MLLNMAEKNFSFWCLAVAFLFVFRIPVKITRTTKRPYITPKRPNALGCDVILLLLAHVS